MQMKNDSADPRSGSTFYERYHTLEEVYISCLKEWDWKESWCAHFQLCSFVFSLCYSSFSLVTVRYNPYQPYSGPWCSPLVHHLTPPHPFKPAFFWLAAPCEQKIWMAGGWSSQPELWPLVMCHTANFGDNPIPSKSRAVLPIPILILILLTYKGYAGESSMLWFMCWIIVHLPNSLEGYCDRLASCPERPLPLGLRQVG